MDKLVSVVVPIYNVEKYLNRCIESIVNQTYKNLEIILVDDGSTDNCPTLCDEWAKKDNRIKVVHKQNAGLGFARNTGIDNAHGKYIFFFDSDDYVDEITVNKCVQNATQHNSDVVIFSRYNVYENGKTVKDDITANELVFSGEAIKNRLIGSMFTYEMGFGVSVCGKMFNLDLIKKHQLRFISEREVISEDSFFALELFSYAATATIIPQSFYYYCRRSNSLSRAYNSQRQNQNDKFLQTALKYVQNYNLPNCVDVAVKARYHGLTLGTLRQIVKANIAPKQKIADLKKIYTNKLLRQTLTTPVLKHDYPIPRIFWRLLKARCYLLCTVLLILK